MKWEYYCQCSLQLKFKQNMYGRLVKPVKHDLSSRSNIFTPVSPISKTEILSGKILLDTTGRGILPDTMVS